MLLPLTGLLVLSSLANAYNFNNDIYDNDLSMRQGDYNPDGTPRIFLNLTETSYITLNTSLLLFSAGILLWSVAAGLALYYLLTLHTAESGGYDNTGYDYGSTGGGYGGRKFHGSYDPYAIDWDKFSIVDWLSIGEEAYRKFDPSDLNCQKRLICEIHQNTSKFGAAASKMVDFFSYLHYAEVLRLPEQFRTLVQEYMDAAERGRTMKKECGEVYDMCDFSVKNMVDKYNHNEI